MLQLCYIAVVLCGLPVLAMQDNGKQIELGQVRRAYRQSLQNGAPKKCVFCDPETLAQNKVLKEDKARNARVVMNKYPYSRFDHLYHLLIMPIAHKESSIDFSLQELAHLADIAHEIGAQLYTTSYSQEYVSSTGPLAGRSVEHFHSHIKVYQDAPCSLPESLRRYKESPTNNMESAFVLVKEKLALSQEKLISFERNASSHKKGCLCCSIGEPSFDEDENNLVVARFKYNFVCLSHHPSITGEVSVVPYEHFSALKDISSVEWRENIALSMALLTQLVKYTTEHIDPCDGGNISTISMGGKASAHDQANHHIYTRVLPRTAIVFPPAALQGTACKLDFDPLHFFAYLKGCVGEVAAEITKQ
jgi:diadenosine tetraphosphate (Ap4A) HIT family hydrolase